MVVDLGQFWDGKFKSDKKFMIGPRAGPVHGLERPEI
jgi:hypothetical protein